MYDSTRRRFRRARRFSHRRIGGEAGLDGGFGGQCRFRRASAPSSTRCILPSTSVYTTVGPGGSPLSFLAARSHTAFRKFMDPVIVLSHGHRPFVSGDGVGLRGPHRRRRAGSAPGSCGRAGEIRVNFFQGGALSSRQSLRRVRVASAARQIFCAGDPASW